MAYANGRIPTSKLTQLPRSWSNQNRVEFLRDDAYASLSRALSRAVAESGENFQIYDAYRDLDEQIAMLKKNYYAVSGGRRSGDRSLNGVTYRRRSGRPATASPGYSNHGTALAIDIHHGGIQSWFKSKGRTYGWTWDEGRKLGESWHFVYDPALDQMKSEGVLDHAWVQKVVGASVDGKIGTGTVAKIKDFQRANGLTADGKVGSTTKSVMLGKAPAPKPAPAPAKEPEPVTAAVDYTIERHQTKNLRKDRIDEKRGLTGKLNAITIHHWGADGQDFDNVVSWLVADGNGNNSSSAHEVIEAGRVAILADIKDGTWNSGSAQGNVDNYALECRPEADAATIATVAARVAAIREEAGWDVPLNKHSDYTATACPGRYSDLLDEIDLLARGGSAVLGAGIEATNTPAPGKLPAGKDALMKLKSVPDFPLLRTNGHKCYYGDASGPVESVSGKNENSLNPGEIYTEGGKTRSRGLIELQKQLNRRGYKVDVDGRWGAQMDNAIDNLQRLAGLTRDKKAGPMTWMAAWLLPVQ